MPIISVDTVYLQGLGQRWQSFERVTVELRQEIQFGLLGNPEIRMLLGPTAYELEDALRRILQEEQELAAYVREIFGWRDQVQAVLGGGGGYGSGLSSSFFQPQSTYTWSYPAQTQTTTISFSSPFSSWYRDPVSIRWLGALIYSRRIQEAPQPFDWRLNRPFGANLTDAIL